MVVGDDILKGLKYFGQSKWQLVQANFGHFDWSCKLTLLLSKYMGIKGILHFLHHLD